MTTKISQLPANQQIAWASATPAAAASTPLLNLTQAWSGTGTFTLDFANVTADPGPSAAASLLIDRQYLGTSQFKVTRGGSGTFAGGINALGGNIQVPGGQFLVFAGKSLIGSTVDGVVQFQTSAGTGAQLTVATLPTATAGAKGSRAMVTDSNTTTFNAVVAGGGANVVPVFCTGTSWNVG